jgi:hypothetical protein
MSPGKPPSAYRPDLRPMLILGGLLVLVVVGWVLLSPLILPRPAPGDATAALAGRWTLSRDDPASSTLGLSAGTYRLEGALDFRGSGTAAYLDGRLTVSDDPACPGVVGRYRVTLGEVDRSGLLPQFRAQSMTLETVDDACAEGLRARTLTGETWILRTSLRPNVHGVCDPPNEEAAITGHWPEPSGC